MKTRWYLLLMLIALSHATAKDAPRATLVSTPTPRTIWTEEESKAYFHPTPTPYPVVKTESDGAGTAMLVLLVIFGTSISLAIYKRRKPKPEPQYRNGEIRQIKFDELDRKVKDNDRTLVVQTTYQPQNIEAALRAQETGRRLAEDKLREAKEKTSLIQRF
jgi:hypothetical protein